jgi:diguanylate cyclase (GGDEF)-like protein
MHSGDASEGPATPIFDEMPVPALADLPLSDPRAADARPDARQRQLAMLLRAVAVAVAAVGLPHAVLGLLFRDPRAVVLGAMAIAYTVWLLREVERLDSSDRSSAIARIADVSLVLVGLAAVLQPSIAAAMAIAALLPPVLTLPFLDGHQVRRVLMLAGFVGIGSVLAGEIVPASSAIPAHLTSALGFMTLILTFGLLLVFLLEVAQRLTSTANDLRSIVAMSNDLSRTMDPQLVGDRIARHIARAVGANDCALSYWDRPNDRVVTLGYFPLERRSALQPTYSLADYPETRRVLEGGAATIVDTADPLADRHEVGYLRSIGQRSMAIVPLVAAGTTVGTVELTSEKSGAFDAQGVELAMMLAGEAAVALENARLYDEIRHQALHDGLTGLANRVLFRDRVVQALERRHGREGRAFAVMFIDLDDFKVVNDTLGHARGDDVLIAAASRVEASLRPSDTAARLGGDEFGVLIDDVGDEQTALSIAIRLADTLRQPIELGDATPTIAASIGVALSGTGDETADDLLRNADVAMYSVKAQGKNATAIYSPHLAGRGREKLELESALFRAIERNELVLHYQPKIDVRGARMVGAEALMRWQRGGVLVPPGEFIPLAEETGLIVPLGQFVLREACAAARAWQDAYPKDAGPSVSVNLSAREFAREDLVSQVEGLLAEFGLRGAGLRLEVTESLIMEDPDAAVVRCLALRELGVAIDVDDFGTGYSSLSYLRRFPVHALKIDRSFVSGMDEQAEDLEIVRAIVNLALTLGMGTVAEGVETAGQAALLRGLGCELGQGYLFAAPMEREKTLAWASSPTR